MRKCRNEGLAKWIALIALIAFTSYTAYAATCDASGTTNENVVNDCDDADSPSCTKTAYFHDAVGGGCNNSEFPAWCTNGDTRECTTAEKDADTCEVKKTVGCNDTDCKSWDNASTSQDQSATKDKKDTNSCS